MKTPYISDYIDSSVSAIPRVSTNLGVRDILGAMRVRWGIGRDNFRVKPGLYAVGSPGPDSDVFVTANYKLSFDHLRKNLQGLNGWILVLDTRGVNVWCAAGKGTFSTKEVVNRMRLVSLDKIVSHRRLILPQLGATGVAAHKVKEETGFNIKYGPVRASEIKKFVDAGYKADTAMRRVTFELADRIKLVPNDLIGSRNYLFGAMLLLCLLAGLENSRYTFGNFREEVFPAALKVFLGYSSGIVLTPILLPWIPGRYFSLKGFITGFLVFASILLLIPEKDNIFITLSWLLIITSISSFVAMNFTGSSTYTSLSGVKKEMKIFVPLQIGLAATGIILQVIGKLIN